MSSTVDFAYIGIRVHYSSKVTLHKVQAYHEQYRSNKNTFYPWMDVYRNLANKSSKMIEDPGVIVLN